MTTTKCTNQPNWVDNLRHLMDEQGFNQRSLSLSAGLNECAVRDLLQGRSRSPRYDTVQALANALNTTPASLMNDDTVGTKIPLKRNAFYGHYEKLTVIIDRLQEIAGEIRRETTACDG
ncbi:MAG: helix-turn-helix transcriptional regulator [Alphaproteobacteria bacterium]